MAANIHFNEAVLPRMIRMAMGSFTSSSLKDFSQRRKPAQDFGAIAAPLPPAQDETPETEAKFSVFKASPEELHALLDSPEETRDLEFACAERIRTLIRQDMQLAFPLAEKAYKRFPHNPALADRMAHLLLSYGRHLDAIPYFEQALETWPTNTILAERLHKCYRKVGLFTKGEELCRRYLPDFPDDKYVLVMAGYQALAERKYGYAMSFANRAINDNSYNAYLLKGKILKTVGRESEADECFKIFNELINARNSAAPADTPHLG